MKFGSTPGGGNPAGRSAKGEDMSRVDSKGYAV